MQNIPMIIDGSNLIPRVLELGVSTEVVAEQFSIRGLMNLVNQRLIDVEDISGVVETAEFVCSNRMLGTKGNKFSTDQQNRFLNRIRSETGVFVDVVDIPGSTEKGVDTTVAGRIQELSESVDCCILASRDKDYIPTLKKMRQKLRVVLFDVRSDAPPELRNEAYSTVELSRDIHALFLYAYQRVNISNLNKETCARLFSNADDREFNQVRVDFSGDVYISKRYTGAEHLHDVKFRYETYVPHNDYVGPLAGSDVDYVATRLTEILRDWEGGRKGMLDY